jgi:hypothetical protein
MDTVLDGQISQSSNLAELLKTKNTYCAGSVKLNMLYIQLKLVAMSKVWVCGCYLKGLHI